MIWTCSHYLSRLSRIGSYTQKIKKFVNLSLFNNIHVHQRLYRKGSDSTEDDFLLDMKHSELFSEVYLRPASGHQIFVIQPELKTSSAAQRKLKSELRIAELSALVRSMPNWSVCGQAIYPVRHVEKKTYFGSGNFEEIGRRLSRIKELTGVVVGVDMLTSRQLAFMQDAWGVPVYDRYTVVLQIFQVRAKTKEARLQVALAEVPYYRSRLHGLHRGTLDQQAGGMGYIGGAGETFLETRQRILREREVKIRKELDKLKDQRLMLRQQRKKNEFITIAVVGYTNAGKTSLIRSLTGDESLVGRDQLFATLDVTMHGGLLPNRMRVVYVDTVGFISDIPTSLIDSFSATLEDVAAADVLVHVRDVSHLDSVAQKENVLQTLSSLEIPQKLLDNMIEVCNKVDLIENRNELKAVDCAADSINISVKKGWGINDLQVRIQNKVLSSCGRVTKHLKVPMNGPHIAWLYKEAAVEKAEVDPRDSQKLLVTAIMSEAAYAKFIHRFGQKKQSEGTEKSKNSL